MTLLVPLALALTLLLDPVSGSFGVEDLPTTSTRVGGEPIEVRIANTRTARAQGFQHASPEQLSTERVLFVWSEPHRPSFHMHNVSAPLDIAWIAEGEIIAIERMTPGEQGYRPPEPVDAALELAPKQTETIGIEPGTQIEIP
ncbi:DUF192 domain-containing protein [Halorhodospira sp. 9622]|uniref:DUF192 domain-containing protein n=1 Tax=Halorhodospira sp. 9622 TaxID=2899136 RepID=UPI001EE93517|nr:DUF192 domain-containing protein [Halorhodospira sp. 9622]MCG5537376.1 DUF192 domain-containing protein [Halorhodospira sp. 9622]